MSKLFIWILMFMSIIFFYLVWASLGHLRTIPELLVVDYIETQPEVQIINDTGILKLSNGCNEVTMIISPDQAMSIERGLRKRSWIRPNAHDLMIQMFEHYGFEILMVKVVLLKNDTFYAKLIIKQGNNILSLDSRPSDAVAVAVRVDAPIYVNKNLLRKVC